MSNQQLRPSQAFAPLRVERTFSRLDDGRGGRAAALAEALGVVIDAAPKVAAHQTKEAFEAGMKARIDGVKRENAGAANKSVLGFMFSKQAQDGFDYQDAQLDLPILQTEELLEMENRLRDSRNPNDFRAYMQERDAIIKERLADKSDIYRYTVASELMKTREQQAKLFAGIVQSNRDKDRRAAVAAVAKANAEAAEQRIRNAGAFIFESIPSEDAQSAPTASSGNLEGVGVKKTTTAPEGFSLGGSAVSGGLSFGELKGGEGDDNLTSSEGSGRPNQVNSRNYRARFMKPDGLSLGEPVTVEEAKKVGGDWFGDTVREAESKFGISTKDAKQIALEAAIHRADLNDDPALLRTIDPRFLRHEQRALLANAIDTIDQERRRNEAERAALADADRKAQEAKIEAEVNATQHNLLNSVISFEMTPQLAYQTALKEHPEYYKNNPEAREKFRKAVTAENSTFTDPFMDTKNMTNFKDEVRRAALTGDNRMLEEAVVDALSKVRDPKLRQKISEIYADTEPFIRNELFDIAGDFEKNITQTFISGVGDEQSLADQISGTKSKQYYPAEADTKVIGMYHNNVLGLAGDWYRANPDAVRMPFEVKYEIHQKASEMAITQGQVYYGNTKPVTTTESTPEAAKTRLKALSKDN